MPQTTYAVDNAVAVPGMIADNGNVDIVSHTANEDIPMGRAVAIRTDGTVELPKSDTAKLCGVSVYKDTLMGTYPQGNPVIKQGDSVAVLRRGRVFADFKTGTQVQLGHPSVMNDTSTAADQGKFTAAAPSAGTVRPVLSDAVFFTKRTDSLALVEIDFTGGNGTATQITGALSTVADAPAKATLTSIIAALKAAGIVIDATT